MAIEKEVNIKVNTSQAQSGLNNLEKSIDGVDNSIKDTNASTQAMGNTLDKATGGAVTKFKALKGALQTAVTGFKSLRVAIIGTGIGALLIAITSVAAAFKSSEEGQNKFAKLMGVIGSVVGNVVDVLSNLGEFIIDLFSGDGAAMSKLKSFGASIFNVIGLPIKNVIDTVKALGKALGALFSGDISGAFDELKQGVEDVKGNFNEAAASINGATDALKNFGKEAIKEAKIAANIADQRAKADKLERDLILEKAKGEKEIAELRLKAKDLNNTTAKEREDALRKVISIQDELTSKEIKAAELRRDAIVEENKLSKSNKDALTAEAEAEAKLIQLQTEKANKARTVQSEITAAENAARSERQAKAKEAEAKRIEEEKEKAAALEAIRLAEIDTEEERRKEELRKVEEQYKKLIAAAIKYGQSTVELEEAQRTKEQELRDKFAKEDKDRADKIKAEEDAKKQKEQEEKIAKLQLDKETEQLSFEEQRELINQRRALLLEDESLSEEQRNELLKQYADANVRITEIENKQKEEASLQYLAIAGNISNLLGKESEAGKALSVATTLVSTYLSAQKAYESQLRLSTPDAPVRAALAAGTAVVSGLANVKSILAINPRGEKSVKGAGGAAAQPQAPNFNIVGANQTSQLADAIGEQTQQPVQAYVVANDVTTAQSLENNIVNGATIG